MDIDASLKEYHPNLLKKNTHHPYTQYNQLATQKVNAKEDIFPENILILFSSIRHVNKKI